MECKLKVLHGESLLFVYRGRQEFTVVDRPLFVEVNCLKDTFEVGGENDGIFECLLHFMKIEEACVLLIEGPESFSETFKIDDVLAKIVD